MFKPDTPKTFASLFSKEAREVKRLKNGTAANKARIAHLETQLKTTKGTK